MPRQLAPNFAPGDRLQIEVTLVAELTENEPVDGGRLLTVRVLDARNRSNDSAVLWTVSADGALELAVEVGSKQRLLALGLSARQRGSLKERLAGLSPADAAELLASIANADNREAETTRNASEKPD